MERPDPAAAQILQNLVTNTIPTPLQGGHHRQQRVEGQCAASEFHRRLQD